MPHFHVHIGTMPAPKAAVQSDWAAQGVPEVAPSGRKLRAKRLLPLVEGSLGALFFLAALLSADVWANRNCRACGCAEGLQFVDGAPRAHRSTSSTP